MGYGGRKRLSLIQMILPTYLKAEFEKREPMLQAPQFYNDVLSSPLSPRGKLMLDHTLKLRDLLLLRLDNGEQFFLLALELLR